MGSPITFRGFNNIDFGRAERDHAAGARAAGGDRDAAKDASGPEFGLCHVRHPLGALESAA